MPRSHDDDGHTVADMNVEGMPWHDKHARGGSGGYTHLRLPERFRAMVSALAMGLVAVGVIIGIMAAFILFCTNVWLK